MDFITDFGKDAQVKLQMGTIFFNKLHNSHIFSNDELLVESASVLFNKLLAKNQPKTGSFFSFCPKAFMFAVDSGYVLDVCFRNLNSVIGYRNFAKFY